MKLSHLRYIIEVAKTGSITRAAQNLYMGQPNLSKAIKDMEADLGFSVFKRSSKGVVPTQRGAELILRASELLEKADSFEDDYFGEKNKSEGLSVAVCGAEWCIPVLEAGVKELEGSSAFKVEYFRCDMWRGLELAKSGEISFAAVRDYSLDGLLEDQLLKSGLEGRRLCSGKRQIVTARSNRAAQKDMIEKADLDNYTEVFIYGTKGSGHGKAAAVSDFASACRVLTEIENSFMVISGRDCGFVSNELCVGDFAAGGDAIDWAVFGEGRKMSGIEENVLNRIVLAGKK